MAVIERRAAALALLAAVGSRGVHDGEGRTATSRHRFGKLGDTPVQIYTLTNANGVVARITNYGAIVTELHVPDKNGAMADVVLGFENLDGYLGNPPYFGAIVGRVANRIGNAEFTLEGRRVHAGAERQAAPPARRPERVGQGGVERKAAGDRRGCRARADLRLEGRRRGLSGHRDGADGVHADRRQRVSKSRWRPRPTRPRSSTWRTTATGTSVATTRARSSITS